MACCKEITQDTCQAAIPAKGNAGDSDIDEQVGPVTAPTGASFDPELWDFCTKLCQLQWDGRMAVII
jgi:hypothetical protein